MLKQFNTREEWLQARRGWIGASDVAAIMERSRFRGPFAVWTEKTRGIASYEMTPIAAAGLMHEPTVAKWFGENSGQVDKETSLADFGDHSVFISDERPHMGCTPDRVMLRNGQRVGVVQVKCCWYRQAELWSKRCPLEYQIQVAAEMYAVDVPVGYYAVMMDGWQFSWYRIERSAKFEKAMLKRCDEFWELVQSDRPPPTDYTDATREALENIYDEPDGSTVYLEPQFENVSKTRESAAAEIKRQTRIKNGATNRIIKAIGNGETGVLPDGVTAYRLKRKDGKMSLRKTKIRR